MEYDQKRTICKTRDIFTQAQEVAAFQDSLGKLNDNSQLERKIGSNVSQPEYRRKI